jgi:splicing factor U2AF subunit
MKTDLSRKYFLDATKERNVLLFAVGKKMADYLASIFGTEKDKVNCSFFFKIGACRHGEHCSKLHNKPTFSQTILLKNLYLSLENSSQKADKSFIADDITEERIQEHFDDTFEELFVELEKKYGEIEEMNICDNLSEHLAGKYSGFDCNFEILLSF